MPNNGKANIPRILFGNDGDPKVELICVCLVCGEKTGKTMDIRSTLVDPRVLNEQAENRMVRSGLCPRCQKAHDDGCTIFYTETRGVILTIEANEKIHPDFRGGVIKIPEDKMDEVMGKT